jgi:hypothetical protein
LRSEQFSGLSEPAIALKNFYQDKGKLPEVCSDTLRAIDDAFVAYNVRSSRSRVCIFQKKRPDTRSLSGGSSKGVHHARHVHGKARKCEEKH